MHIILRSLWQRHLPLTRRASSKNFSIFARATLQYYETSAESPRTRSGKLWGVWGVLAAHGRLTHRKSGLLGPGEQHARLYTRGACEAFRIALDSYISWCIKVGFGQIISVRNPKFRGSRSIDRTRSNCGRMCQNQPLPKGTVDVVPHKRIHTAKLQGSLRGTPHPPPSTANFPEAFVAQGFCGHFWTLGNCVIKYRVSVHS